MSRLSRKDERIARLLKTCVDKGQAIATQYRDIGRANERLCMGDQFSLIGGYRDGAYVVKQLDPNIFDEMPRVAVNKMQGLKMVFASLLNKSRISATAFPATEEPEDTYRAEIGNAVIDFIIEEEGTAKKTHLLIQRACEHGSSALKVWYDAEEDCVRWANVSIFDFLIDTEAEDYREAKWCAFQRWICKEDAEEEFKAARIQKEITEQDYDAVNGEKHRGVECWELWHKPTREFPQGIFAMFVDKECVQAMEYPYAFDTDGKPEYLLPIVIMKCREMRGSAYGTTNLTDCAAIQRIINEGNSRILKLQRDTAGAHLRIPKRIKDGFDASVFQTIGYDPDESPGDIGYTMPPDIPPGWERRVEYFESKMPEVMGLNQLTTGDQNLTLSGVAMESIFALDAEKNADAAKSLEEAVLQAWRLTLALVAHYYTDQRKIKISNGTAMDIVAFDGADIQGVDIRLEIGSELDKQDQVKQASVEGKVEKGTAGPDDLALARKAPGIGLSKRIAQQIIDDFMAGQDVEQAAMGAGTDFSLDVFKQLVAKAKARAKSSGQSEDWSALHALQVAVEGFAADAAHDSPAPGAPPPDPSAAPPVPPTPMPGASP